MKFKINKLIIIFMCMVHFLFYLLLIKWYFYFK